LRTSSISAVSGTQYRNRKSPRQRAATKQRQRTIPSHLQPDLNRLRHADAIRRILDGHGNGKYRACSQLRSSLAVEIQAFRRAAFIRSKCYKRNIQPWVPNRIVSIGQT
jgi:hypothetical protein